MRFTPLLLALLLPAALRAADGDVAAWSQEVPKALAERIEAAAAAPGYGDATAHDPRFADAALWPMLSGKERFVAQTWPKGRVLTWAHPGKNGGPRFGKDALDPTRPENWLEDGKPCTAFALDETVDLVLPASDKPYSVGFRDTPLRETVRHLTINPGASFSGGGDGVGRTIHGCVWVKKGGRMSAQGATRFVGDGAVFVRNDNVEENPRKERHVSLHMLSQYFEFTKPATAPIEFIGRVIVLDEFGIIGSTVIVGPDSRLQPGRSAAPRIEKGGTLALLDGAYFGSWVNNFAIPDLQVTGTLQGGLPERPLTRPCGFGLGFKNHGDAQYDGPGAEQKRGQTIRYARVPSLVLRSGSAVRSHSADPARARLTFVYQLEGRGAREALYVRPLPGSPGEADLLKREPALAQRFAWFDALPRGVDIWFAAGVAVDTVTFDHLRPGGLMLSDAADRGAWKDVAFGPGCLATGDALFAAATPLKGTSY